MNHMTSSAYLNEAADWSFADEAEYQRRRRAMTAKHQGPCLPREVEEQRKQQRIADLKAKHGANWWIWMNKR